MICSNINMSKVYRKSDFYKPFLNATKSVDCSDITGINCYADNEALDRLRDRLQDVPLYGLHFIDSGNFHYLTYLFLERIRTDFVLVLIDKHPDCKTPLFGDIMSCGGWVRSALDSIAHLQSVYMVGIDDALLYELDDVGKNRDRVNVTSALSELSGIDLPVYLSIDKDVLDESIVVTNWDQGKMRFDELDEWITTVINEHEIIGVDVCGEPSLDDEYSAYEVSSAINGHLMSLITDNIIS